jgi:hypothetical protein
MALLGKGALAMWWDIAPALKADFEDWHAHEHFPERLSVPGFRRGTRWSDRSGGTGVLVLYELDDHAVVSSAAYVARLNAPTPWSTRLMPHHRNMVRSQCHVLETRGGVVARHAMTLRLSPAPGREQDLRAHLGSLAAACAIRPGLVGAHMLRHRTPDIAQTTEQRIRAAADQAADWIVVVCGYDPDALDDLARGDLAADRLAMHGAGPEPARGVYTLSYSATATDVR